MEDERSAPDSPEAAEPSEARVPQPRGYPSILQAVGLLVLLLLVQLFVGVVLGVVTGVLGSEPDLALSTSVANVAGFGLVLGIIVLVARRPVREIFSFAPVPHDFWLAVLFTSVGWSILGSELANVISMVLPPPDWVNDLFSDLLSTGFSSIMLLVVIAPVTEELLFRGAILQGFLKRYSARTAILVSALMFGALHLNPWQFGPTVVLGILYGWWCLRTKSLAPALVGHALNNGMGLMVVGLFGLDIEGYTEDLGTSLQPLWLDILGVALFAAGILLAKHSFAAKDAPGSSVSRG